MNDVLEQKMRQLPMTARREIAEYLDFLIFKYGTAPRSRPKPYAGCMKGTVTWMSDDFNAPLEDFKEYQ